MVWGFAPGRALAPGTIYHYIGPVTGGDSGAPSTTPPNGRIIGIHVGGTDGHTDADAENIGVMVQASSIIACATTTSLNGTTGASAIKHAPSFEQETRIPS